MTGENLEGEEITGEKICGKENKNRAERNCRAPREEGETREFTN